MSHNAYTRVAGNWTDGVDVPAASDLESFEQKMFTAINGDDGGTWAPGDPIEIGGDGLQGRVRPMVVNGIDFAHTYFATGQNQAIRVGSGVTANRVYTLSATGALDGDTITIFTVPGFLYKIFVQFPGGTTLYTVSQLDVTANGKWVTLIFKGAAWEVYTAAPVPFVEQSFTWLVGGTITFPAGVEYAYAECMGGGGGGAGGCTMTAGGNKWANGGGGGGGAIATYQRFSTTGGGGGICNISIGAGGAGGAPNSNGGDATDSSVVQGVTVLARGRGAGGGGGARENSGVNNYYLEYGGLPGSSSLLLSALQRRIQGASAGYLPTIVHNGQGGHSSGAGAFSGGSPHSGIATPGTAGTAGADSGIYLGGMGGGGGGASSGLYVPIVTPADGPAGGAGGAVTGGGGGTGIAAQANSGCGGSGGGGGGGAGTTPGVGGTGGNGAAGWVRVTWVGPAATITGT